MKPQAAALAGTAVAVNIVKTVCECLGVLSDGVKI